MKAKIDELKAELVRKGEDIMGLTNERSHLKKEIEKLNSNLHDRKNEISGLMFKLKQFENNIKGI